MFLLLRIGRLCDKYKCSDAVQTLIGLLCFSSASREGPLQMLSEVTTEILAMPALEKKQNFLFADYPHSFLSCTQDIAVLIA